MQRKNLNLTQSQTSFIPTQNVIPTTLTIPSQSAFAWGAPSIIDLKIKNIKVHEAILALTLGAVTGVTPDGTTYPNLNPSSSFFSKVEIVVDGNVEETINPDFNFIRNQLYASDIDRAMNNYAMGSYTNTSSRYTKTVSGSVWYLNLACLFHQTNLALLNSHHDVQLRITLAPLASVINVGALVGTAVVPINGASLIIRTTQLDSSISQRLLVEMSKVPKHNLFLATRYLPFPLNSGITSSTSTLTFTGSLHSLYFIVRPTTGLNGIAQFTYKAIKDFSILSASGENISGGVVIPSDFNLLEQQKWYTESTFPMEAFTGVNSSNCYMYSFSVDPVAAYKSGAMYGSRVFQGNEQLVLNYVSALSGTHQLDVFALVESAIEQTNLQCKHIEIR